VGPGLVSPLFVILRTITYEGRQGPAIAVIFYQEEDSAVPLLEWFAGLQSQTLEQCLARLVRLEGLCDAFHSSAGDEV
jgi:hypothetical protein